MNKAVVVMGAERGLGKAISKVLLGKGYHLIAASISMSDAELMKREMIDNVKIPAERVDLIEFDMRNLDKVDVFVDSVRVCLNKKPIYLWGYVNVAGIFYASSRSHKLTDICLEDIMEVLKVDEISAFLLSREMFKIIKEGKKGGAIILISSNSSKRGSVMHPVYAMAKASLVNLAMSIAIEGGAEGIRANAISPGIMETQMGREIIKTKEDLAKRLERSLIKRSCTPEEVAHLVSYLLSDYGSYITGENLDISGGRLLT
jgi:3-oxoacyl-[acyl-carrier protein] reductase